MPDDHARAARSAQTSIGATLMEEARRAGLLDDKTEHVSFRAPKALIDAAKRETGVRTDHRTWPRRVGGSGAPGPRGSSDAEDPRLARSDAYA